MNMFLLLISCTFQYSSQALFDGDGISRVKHEFISSLSWVANRGSSTPRRHAYLVPTVTEISSGLVGQACPCGFLHTHENQIFLSRSMGKRSANKVLSVREFERQPQTVRILVDGQNEGPQGRGSPKKRIPDWYNVGVGFRKS